MKPSIYSAFEDRVSTVFDKSKAGERVAAERWDEPGAESPVLRDEAQFDLMADLVGDWSWKPARDKSFGDNMVTFKGVPKGAAELYGPRIRN